MAWGRGDRHGKGHIGGNGREKEMETYSTVEACIWKMNGILERGNDSPATEESLLFREIPISCRDLRRKL